MSDIKSVLFICTGNSCRSVMAEGLLKKYLEELGKGHIEVHSAGICAVSGFPPTEETIEIMLDEGIDTSHFKATYLTDSLIEKSGLILTMEERHKEAVLNKMPEANSKTYLLKEFGVKPGERGADDFDIADPIGKSIKEYEHILKIIKGEVRRIAEIV